MKKYGIPHTAVWGLFILSLQDRRAAAIVSSPSFPSLREGKEGKENGESGAPVCRLSMNNPPTSVGGISESSLKLMVSRKSW